MGYDLILKGGRVIDLSQSIDGVRDVAFAGGKVAAVANELQATSETEIHIETQSVPRAHLAARLCTGWLRRAAQP